MVELKQNGEVRVLVSGNADDEPRVEMALTAPTGLALGPREEVYFVDSDKLYRYEGGQVEVFAGGGTSTEDNIDAKSAKLVMPSGIAVDKSGNLYVSERGEEGKEGGHRVRKITSGGVITTVAGNGTAGYAGDGEDAKTAQLNSPHGLALDEEGQLYIVDTGNNRIRRISSDGLIQTVIGGGTSALFQGSLAVNVKLNVPDGIAAGPDGSLYIATKETVLRTYVGMPKLNKTEHLVPSTDGRTLYRFDARGKHLQTIDAMTGITELSFTHDSAGLLTAITDKDGNKTLIERGSDGNPKEIVAPFGQRTVLEIKSNGNVGTITDPIGRTTTITWKDEKDGLVSEVKDPKEKATTFHYDPTGRMLDMTDPTGYKTTLARSEVSKGWSVAVTNPNASTTRYQTTYSGEKWTRTVTHPDGSESVTVDSGATLEQRSVDGSKRFITFNADMSFGGQSLVPYEDTVTLPSGKALASESARSKGLSDINNPLDLSEWVDDVTVNGRYAKASYVRATRTLTQTSPMGRVTELTLDELGRPSRMVRAGLPTTEWQYDGKGRVVKVTRSVGTEQRVQTYDYGDGGWVEYFTDALGEKTKYSRDNVGRLRELLAPDEAKTQWVLDDADNVTSYVPPARLQTVFSYDEKTKLLTKVVPPTVTLSNAGNESFAYGKLNELTKLTRADGKSIGFTYDPWGRLSSQKLGTASINFYYNRGHLTRINRSDGVTVDQTFDGALWTGSSWSGSVKGDVKATYNENLWLSSLTVNSASTVNFAYDDDGLLTSASASGGAVKLNRDALTGYVNSTAIGNTTSQHTYTDFGELSRIRAAFNGASLFEQNITARDALGRVTHLTENIAGVPREVTYEYDLAGRLAKETRDGITTSYTYDPNGNRISVQVGNQAATTALYDAQDRILSYGSQTYTHTDHGDLLSRVDGADTLTLTYDELGNLLKAVNIEGSVKTTIEYVVDGLGRRVARRINGNFDRAWLYRDSLRPVSEVDSAGVFTLFVYASNAEESGAPIALIRAGVFYRVVKDHLGSVRLVVNATTGEVAQSIDYDAYGRVINETGTGFQPFGFAGGLYDSATKLVRFGARDYDPSTGRWTNKDPIGFAGQQGNVYLYVGGDPVNGRDPRGTDVWIEGPSPSEPSGHLSVSIGDPNGKYRSFSYGSDMTWTIRKPLCLLGSVYEDKNIGGVVLEYLKTSAAEDQAIIWNLEHLVGGPSPYATDGSCYTFGNVCRDFSRQVWSTILDSGAGIPSRPQPTLRDNTVSSDVPMWVSICQN
jgi:RHS repeat-associated protein